MRPRRELVSAAAAVDVVERYLDASNRGDVAAMVALTAPAYEFGTARSVMRGRVALRSALHTPRPFDVTFEPRRWFADAEQVVCVAQASFRRRATGEAAGAAPRFLRAEVRDGRLRRLQVGYEDAAAALADAQLSEADEQKAGDPSG